MLAAGGYRTGIFGKWHLGDNYPMRAMDRGFQESLVLNGGSLAQPSDPPDPVDERGAYFNATLRHNGMGKNQGLRQRRADGSGDAVYRAEPPAAVFRLFGQTMGANSTEAITRVFRGGRARRSRAASTSSAPFVGRRELHAGRRVDRIAACFDLAPTLLDLCGVPKPERTTRWNYTTWPPRTRIADPTQGRIRRLVQRCDRPLRLHRARTHLPHGCLDRGARRAAGLWQPCLARAVQIHGRRGRPAGAGSEHEP